MEWPNLNLKALTVLLKAAYALYEVIKKNVAHVNLSPTELSVLELLYHRRQ